jgi:hypothetical protein
MGWLRRQELAMPSTPRKIRRQRAVNFLVSLSLKLGSGLFAMGLGGLLSQYLQRNPNGMLLFVCFMVAGLIVTAVGLIAEDDDRDE